MPTPEAAQDLPDWVPDDYYLDAPLRERLRHIADVEGGIELHAKDDRGTVYTLGAPHELTETHGVLTLKAGGRDCFWDYEVVVPPNEADARLKSVDTDQDLDGYLDSKQTLGTGVDVRVYGVDRERFEEDDEQASGAGVGA
jgi:hypothetical protein